MSVQTNEQYDSVLKSCKDIFIKKTKDYGTSWRCLRIISIVDQIFIKAMRIRTIQEKKAQLISDGIKSEFMGIVNYGIIGLIQLELNSAEVEELLEDQATSLYDKYAAAARTTMLDKNHDYGEAWRDMSQESFVDLTITKLSRIKQILSNDGKTLISEGMDANLIDIINYSLFGLILIGEGKSGHAS
jgi:hypothetical protein